MDPIRFRLKSFLLASVGVVFLGTVGFWWLEGVSLYDAFYFCIVTVATVGYGDFHPSTEMGKFLAITIIFLGVGTFLGVVANASELMLNRREKQARFEKMHMLIGVFYSEVGTQMIKSLRDYDPNLQTLKQDLVVTNRWTPRDFAQRIEMMKTFNYKPDMQRVDLDALYRMLRDNRSFLVRLMENPILIEHESFTQLLRAVFHLMEELSHRQGVGPLPDSDKKHLAGDIKRAFNLVACQWLDYMSFLKNNYPYLFSLSARMNPFDAQASPVVKS